MERGKQTASLPSLGLLTLAGMTPRHHDIHYIEVPDVQSKLTIDNLDCTFDLVAISSYGTQCYCTSVVLGEGEPVWLQ